MGWIVENRQLTDQTPAQRIARDLAFETETHSSSVLAAATVGNTVYAAVQRRIKATNQSFVFCAVVLFSNSRKDGFGTKFMDETVGPYAVDCPDRIMKLLSPLSEIPEPAYAGDWRARVKAAQQAKAAINALKSGDIARLANPVTFPSQPTPVDVFRFVTRLGRRLIFAPIDQPGFQCQIPRPLLIAATIERASHHRQAPPNAASADETGAVQ